MRLGYFGGSFDPPHLGHLAVARAAAQSFALDRVLFVPTSRQPLKPSGPSASYADRLAMVSLLCAQAEASYAPRFTASDLEAPHPDHTPHYTVDTLTQLRATLHPADQLFVLTGADAFLDLKRWREPSRLLTLADWIVLSRPGFDHTRLDALIDTLTRTLNPAARIHHLDTLAHPASATALRQALTQQPPTPASELTLSEALPPTILTYIRQHHLYKAESHALS